MEDLALVVTTVLLVGWGLGLVSIGLALWSRFGKLSPRLAWYPTAFTLAAAIYFFFFSSDRLGLLLGAGPLIAVIILLWRTKK